MYGTLSNRNNATHMKKYLNLDHVRKVTTQISPRISEIRSNFNCLHKQHIDRGESEQCGHFAYKSTF